VRRMLDFVPASGARAEVSVQPHKEHGTMIHVRLSGGDPAARDAITAQVKTKLNPLTLRHAVEWTNE
jgi:hypothetical protein